MTDRLTPQQAACAACDGSCGVCPYVQPSTPAPSGGDALTDDEREDYEWMVRSLLGLLDSTTGDTVRKAQVRGIIETTMPLAARAAQPGTPIDVDGLNREHPLDGRGPTS
jgi:mono/diheme cytochrome c family protein